MSPGQDSVDRYLAEHETPIDRSVRLIREDERAKIRAKVEALRAQASYEELYIYDKMLALLDGGSDD